MRLNSQAVVRDALAKALTDATVGVTVPRPRPKHFVLVRREGGSMQDAYRDKPGIGIFCWAPTEAGAANLASRVSQIMFSLEYTPGIASVVEEVFTSASDTEDSSPRWYGSYTLITYEIKE